MPWRVLLTNQRSAISSGIVTIATKTCSTLMVTVSIPTYDSTLTLGRMASTPSLAGPKMSSAMFWRTKLMPIAEMSGASFGALRRGR